MQSYKSHKTVEAAKIVRVGADVVLTDDGGLYIHTKISPRYIPHPGDYVVRYADGYHSISPEKAFLEGYELVNRP